MDNFELQLLATKRLTPIGLAARRIFQNLLIFLVSKSGNE